MPDVYIDTYCFACPPPGSASEIVQDYVTALLEIFTSASCPHVSYYVSANAFHALETASALPPMGPSHLTPHLQPRDVATIIYGLLTKLPTLEATLDISDLLMDNPTTDRNELLASRPSPLVEDLFRAMAIIGVTAPSGKFPGASVMSRGVSGPLPVEFRTIVTLIDRPLGQPFDLPASVQLSFTLLGSTLDLARFLNPTMVLMAGHLQGAIELAAFHDLQFSGPNPLIREAVTYSIGPRFSETAERYQFMAIQSRAAALLRASSRTLLRRNMAHTHAIRTSKGASSQLTRQRDDASAWRRDIDHEFHLHYWQTDNGPEFACVSPHSNMWIPE